MRLIGFDVETWGDEPQFALQPCRAQTGRAWLTSYASSLLAQDGVQTTTTGTHRPTPETLRRFLRFCAERDLTLVCWNAAFDVAWLIALGLKDEVFACKWLDAMLLHRHLKGEPTYTVNPLVPSWSLKEAVRLYLPEHAGYEKDVDFGSTDPVISEQRLTYNKLDAEFTVKLAQQFWDQLTPGQQQAALIEAETIPFAAETMVEGITADGDAAKVLTDRLEGVANSNYVTLRMLDTHGIDREVLASPTKLRMFLFGHWGLTPPRYTEKGAESTDKEALAILATQDIRAKYLHDYREATNNRTKFAEGTLNALEYNGDGRVRPAFKIFGTYTGRGTYSSKVGRGKEERPSGIALHQWKRDPEFRALLKPPPGYTLLEFDFAGQEFRWMAVESKDPTMLQLCQPGEDAHAFMGGRVRSMTYREMQQGLINDTATYKPIRQLGKVANLSLQYRTSWMRLLTVAMTDHGITLSDLEARAIHATYRQTYPGVPKYWRKQIEFVKRNEYVETMAGRRLIVRREGATSAWSMEQTAINYPIQGIGADQKYLALKVLKDYLPRVDGRFYFELHDGLFVVVPDAKAQKAAVEIKALLSNLPYREAWGTAFPIQFPVDAKIGPSWGQLKEFHG